MTDRARTPDVLVIGGGVIGLAVAWRARREGLSVTVLERDRTGQGTSWVAAGMLAPVAEVEFGEAGRRMLELGLRSARMWPEFAERLAAAGGTDVGLLRSGTLLLARDEDEARELDRQIALRESLGLPGTRLRPSQAREREPALTPSVRLAFEAPEDHSVDPRRVLAALRAACLSAGVRLRERSPVARIETDAARERVTGVTLAASVAAAGGMAPGGAADADAAAAAALEGATDAGADGAADAGADGAADAGADGAADAGADGAADAGADGEFLAARQIVIAAGPWTGEIAGIAAHERPPVRPVRGQLLRLRDPAGAGLLRRVVRFGGGYLVPRADGRYILGATVEERGFDLRPQAGGVYELLRDAHELIPGVGELEIEELCVGLRPGTPDNAPAIGHGALDGLTWATGHYRNGILLAPLTAELVARLLVGEQPADPLLSSCSPARFVAVDAHDARHASPPKVGLSS